MGTDKPTPHFLFGKTRRAILALLYANPEKSFYLRQILGIVQTGNGALQRELKRLTEAGLILRLTAGSRVLYRANLSSPDFAQIQNLIKVKSSLVPVVNANILLPENEIKDFCRCHHIRRLSLYGSVIRDDFSPDSDVDVLVEYQPGFVPGFEIVAQQAELSSILKRRVDLRTPGDLSRYFRDQVVREARVQYEVA